MPRYYSHLLWGGCLVLMLALFSNIDALAEKNVYLQDLSSPTPTGVQGALGVTATVLINENPDINVRAGPGVDYALVGKLLAGQQVPALGRTPGGDWVQIVYPDSPAGVAWVYSFLISLSGTLPIVEPPPTPTPLTTPTVDPTLAAQFIREIPPTRLPTFTPPPPLVIPTFTAEAPAEIADQSLFVYLVAGLGILGVLGFLLSLIRVR
jgi:hypothetical protein